MTRLLALLALGLWAAATGAAPPEDMQREAVAPGVVEVELQADLSGISLRQARIIRLLVRAADLVGEVHRAQLAPGGLYPEDMTPAEFAAWDDPAAADPLTVIRRDAAGALVAVPYHQAWPTELGQVARLLARAAEITQDEDLRHYLTQRARALIVGDHPRAERAWLALAHSDIDALIGPLGTDEDARFGLKSTFGAYLLLRDWAWGARLARFKVFLPELQRALPVSAAFKAEVPEVDMKLAVYDLLYHAGYGAARAGVIAPDAADDRRVRLERGPRQLQLRNVMRARFEALVAPVAARMLVPEQRGQVRFEAFFLDAMLREMAHALGPRRTVSSGIEVAAALGAQAGLVEAAKAAVLSLWMAAELHARGELPETRLAEHYASFLAGAFRAIQLDPGSDAGRAQLLLFNHFRDWGAFRRDPDSGLYRVQAEDMTRAVEAMAAQLLTLQGSGDRAGAAALAQAMAVTRSDFRIDLQRLAAAGVPDAIVFRQGLEQLGLDQPGL
ncbi:MAG TPA: Zn-dependent hydrolase [Gammaproteobacteria bacterium]|nr:Zn-dependent hydrolase [Gammaproteobacteria bacterium]